MNLKPLQDKVVLEIVEEAQKTESGIILPNNLSEKPHLAKVVAVGGGTKDCEMLVNKNDKVLYSKYAGSEFRYNNKNYVLISQQDIFAIVEEK